MIGSSDWNVSRLVLGRRSVLLGFLAPAGLLLGRRVPAQAATETLVAMQKLNFAPAEIAIRAGESVTFVNLDLVAHTATAVDKSFDTGILRQGERKAIAFLAPGEFPYVCRFHPHMKGVIRIG